MSTVSETIDAQLLQRLNHTEDQHAFADLSRRYIDFIYATALRQSNDPAMAADVTQAVLLVLARRAKSIRAVALPTWLHRVTTYAMKNAQRAERRRRRHERAAASQRPEFTMTTDETESIKPILDRAIASLPAKDQTVVIERFLCGRELGDVAATLGASTAATQKRLERAVGRLRDYFQRHGIVLSAAGVPWPPLHAAPIGVTKAVGSQASISTHSLAGKIMNHLFWTKLASVTVGVALVAAVTGATSVELSHLAHAEAPTPPPTQPAANPALVAHLSHGVTVTIDGIASMNDRQKIWQADGTSNASVSWRVPQYAQFGQRVENGVTLPQFAVVARAAGDAAAPPEVCGFSFNGSVGVDNGFTPQPLDHATRGEVGPGESLTGLINSFKPTDTVARMRFNVAVGEFVRPLEPPDIMGNGGSVGKAFGGRYVIGKPFLRDGIAAVIISTTGIDDVQDRLVANIVENGKQRAVNGQIVDGMSSGPLLQRTFTFADVRNIDVIRTVELRFRPIEWCEFENVSLQPDHKTQVKITTSGSTSAIATQPAVASSNSNEVYIGGDAPRTGVYKISPQLVTVSDLLEAAGVHITPRDAFSVRHRPTQSPAEFDNLNGKDGAAEQLLEPGDQIFVTLSPPPVPADSKLAPFTDIRWKGDDAEILINGSWNRWLAINDIPVSSVVAAARDIDDRIWQKRVAEDLVQVMNHVPDAAGRSDVGKDVRFTIQTPSGVTTLNHVAMTEENRRSVYLRRRERNED